MGLKQKNNQEEKQSDLLNKANNLKPIFSNKKAARESFEEEMNILTEKYNCTTAELIKRAEKNPLLKDMEQALSLSRKIQALKGL